MFGDDSKGIHEFILDRLDQIHEENVLTDLEYQKLGAKPKAAMDQLWKSLDPENRKLLDEFDCGRMAQMCRQDELIYSRGLMDGIRLAVGSNGSNVVKTSWFRERRGGLCQWTGS